MGLMKSSERGSSRLRCGLGLGLLAAVACAAQPKADMSPPGEPASVQAVPPAASTAPAPEAAEPRTLEEAEALLERSRADLERLALNEPAPTSAGAVAPKAAPAPPARAESRRLDEGADGAPPAAKADSQCDTACRAFASLTRASDAVCRLDADGGKRCDRARQIREQASQRVASCGCVK
jgi:hypothetical protein